LDGKHYAKPPLLLRGLAASSDSAASSSQTLYDFMIWDEKGEYQIWLEKRILLAVQITIGYAVFLGIGTETP
jgi:hypothetical protein